MKFCCKFLAFLKRFAIKNIKNDYFDQYLECVAPKRWSKYTTLVILGLKFSNLFELLKYNRQNKAIYTKGSQLYPVILWRLYPVSISAEANFIMGSHQVLIPRHEQLGEVRAGFLGNVPASRGLLSVNVLTEKKIGILSFKSF